jgi:hypothetical protein
MRMWRMRNKESGAIALLALLFALAAMLLLLGALIPNEIKSRQSVNESFAAARLLRLAASENSADKIWALYVPLQNLTGSLAAAPTCQAMFLTQSMETTPPRGYQAPQLTATGSPVTTTGCPTGSTGFAISLAPKDRLEASRYLYIGSSDPQNVHCNSNQAASEADPVCYSTVISQTTSVPPCQTNCGSSPSILGSGSVSGVTTPPESVTYENIGINSTTNPVTLAGTTTNWEDIGNIQSNTLTNGGTLQVHASGCTNPEGGTNLAGTSFLISWFAQGDSGNIYTLNGCVLDSTGSCDQPFSGIPSVANSTATIYSAMAIQASNANCGNWSASWMIYGPNN